MHLFPLWATPSRTLHLAVVVAALVAVLAAAPPAPADLQAIDSWGGLGSDVGHLGAGASGIAVTPSGRVFVADTSNHRVESFAPDGTPIGAFAGLGAGQPRLNEPVGVAVDGAGRLFVTETQGDRLHRYAADGTPVGTSGGHGTGPESFNEPSGVAIARDGSVLVTDRGNARVQVLAPTGGFLTSWGAGVLTDPYGIAVAPDGDVYVTDRAQGRVRRFSAGGTLEATLDGTGTTAGKLVEPTGVAVDRTGAVHVADAGRDIVVTFSGATATVLAPPLAPFQDPAGLATDCRASVYVVDAGHGSVRRFGRADAVPPPCSPPTAAFSAAPPTTTPGGQVFFDASASHDDGRIVRMDWDLDGDGIFEAIDAGPSVTQIFNRVGGSPVTLRVTDDDGQQAQVTQAVTVVARALAASVTSPTIGVTLLADRTSGTVRFRRPGANATEELTRRLLLPVGTRFDTTAGRVRLTLSTGPGLQSGIFWDGIFTVFQGPTAALTELVLADLEEQEPDAKPKARTSATRRRKSRLWGDAKGSFKTSGRNAAATVRGTRWLTEDVDEGTAVQVADGSVSVRDFVAGRTVEVSKGRRYVARDACESRRDFRVRLRVPVGMIVRSASVRLNGRPVRVRYVGGRLTAVVNLRGRPAGRQVLRITLVGTNGARVSGSRVYRTCLDKRRDRVPPRI